MILLSGFLSFLPLYWPSVCLSVFSLLVVEQCICNRMQADEMVLEWVAFSTNKNGLKLNLDNLEQFEHEVAIYFFFLLLINIKELLFTSLFCSLFVQVLNRRKKSKHSAKKEAFNRTRDVHTLQDLYPPQQSLYKVSPAFCCKCLEVWGHCVIPSLTEIILELKQRKRRRICWTRMPHLAKWDAFRT